jgi:hypothetical protein
VEAGLRDAFDQRKLDALAEFVGRTSRNRLRNAARNQLSGMTTFMRGTHLASVPTRYRNFGRC